MKKFFVLAILAILQHPAAQSQSVANKFLKTKGWKGTFKMTITEIDTLEGITTYFMASGPATVMNTNPKTPVSMIWPQPSMGQMQAMPQGNDPQVLAAYGQGIANGYLQWDAQISYTRKEKMDHFPVDTRNFQCNYDGRKKSNLVISVYADEFKEEWFEVKGVAITNPEECACNGEMDGQPVHLNTLPNPSVLKYEAVGHAARNLSVYKGPQFKGKNDYHEGNRYIVVEFDFTAIN